MSGLAGQAIGLEDQSPTPIGGDAAVDAESKGSMENFIGFGLGATSYDPDPVDFDAADDTVTSAADGTSRIAPDYTDGELLWGGSTPADGILFDTARGDSFVGNFVATPSNGAVITPTSITLDSATPVNVAILLQNAGSNVNQCFDDWFIEVEYQLTGPFGGADVPGILHGYRDDPSGSWSGVMDRGHGGAGGGTAFPSKWLQSGAYGYGDGGKAIGAGISCSGKLSLVKSKIDFFLVYDGTSPGINQSLDLVYTAGTTELPRMFNAIGIQFQGGHAVINSIKISVAYPNAKYGLIGDSITQGRFATTYAEGWGSVFRTSYLDDTLLCGAPSAKIADWTAENIAVVAKMKPKYAIVMLGTNDATFLATLPEMQADYTAVISEIESHGIIPIAIGIPPCNQYVPADFNDWLQATYSHYVDCYTPLLGTGVTMAPAYDSGDGVHPNSAGHALIASTIETAIVANGWN